MMGVNSMPGRLSPEEFNRRCILHGLPLPAIPYKTCRTEIKFNCNACGKTCHKFPRSYLKSKGLCKECTRKSQMKTNAQFVQECKDKGLDIPFDTYKGATTKIRFICSICGKLYPQEPYAHLKGEGHYKCNGGHKKTTREYIEECKEKHLDLPVDEYDGENTEIYHKCLICGKHYKITPKMHLRGVQHRVHFSFSTGEKLIYRWLLEHDYRFKYQKRFGDLRTGKVNLSYDFYLPAIGVLIEYQGQQHFRPMAFNHGLEKFKRQQINDARKADYAKKHNLILLTPDYHIDTYDKIDSYMRMNVEPLIKGKI